MLKTQSITLKTKSQASIFNILDSGLCPDGTEDYTPAIQQTIDTCHAEGGGIVLVPKGIYNIRPISLRSNVNLHLEKDAILVGSPEAGDYQDLESDLFKCEKAPYNAKYLIVAVGAENVSITGEGRIEGNVEAHYDLNSCNGRWWKVIDKKTRPGRMVWFAMCRNVHLQDVSLFNAPAWSLWVMGCENVEIRNLQIRTPYEAINTDGIDIDCCRNVHISHCDIRTGDDAVVLRAVNRIYHEGNPPCEQVVVENCTLASNCQAVRLSYIRDGIIRNVKMDNLTIYDSTRGIICQIPSPEQTPEKNMTASHIANGPVVENVAFTNIRVEARQPLWFYIADNTPADRVNNIRFENIHLSGCTPSLFRGSSHVPLQNIVFRNLSFEIGKGEKVFARPEELWGSAVALGLENMEQVVFENITVSGDCSEHAEKLPLVALNSVKNLVMGDWTNQTDRELRK